MVSNSTTASSLASGFVHSVSRWPDRIALEVGPEKYTYRDLAARASTLSSILRENEASGSFVAVLGYRSVGAFSSVLGVLLSGKGYVPLNPTFPASRSQKMLEASGCRVVVVSEECKIGRAHV